LTPLFQRSVPGKLKKFDVLTGETSIAAITAIPTTTKTANPTRGGAVPSLLRLSGVGVTRS
jgi:hypothetical protein